MNSDMVRPEKFGHLHLVYHFTVPLRQASYSDRICAFLCSAQYARNFAFLLKMVGKKAACLVSYEDYAIFCFCLTF